MTTLKYPGLQKYDEKIKEWVANVTSPMVHKSGNENISGIKKFLESPLVPTPAVTDATTKSANTEWVKSLFTPAGGFSFTDDGLIEIDFQELTVDQLVPLCDPDGGIVVNEDPASAGYGKLKINFQDLTVDQVLSLCDPDGGIVVNEDSQTVGYGKLKIDFSAMPPEQREEILKDIHVPIWIGENGVGTEFYVDGINGEDNEDAITVGDTTYIRGRSATYPWQTLQFATQNICKNYNINSRTVHINVAGGTYNYTSNITLPLQQRTTGGIIIRPYAGETVNIVRTSTASVSLFSHSGGQWTLSDLNIKLVINQQSHTSGWAFPHILYSSDSTGSVDLVHCNLEFEDNSVAPSPGTYGYVAPRLIAINGGRVSIRNTVENESGVAVDASYDCSWSGDIGNSNAVTWIYVENGGILELEKPGAQGLRAFHINVSGSYTTFCDVSQKGLMRTSGTGPATLFVPIDSPTGKRYTIETGGTVTTGVNAADVETFFPGDVPGTVENKTYSWISPHKNYYAPNIQFDPTPVYSVTLAEDVTALASAPYVIELDDAYQQLLVCTTMKPYSDMSAATTSLYCGAVFGSDKRYAQTSAGISKTDDIKSYFFMNVTNGFFDARVTLEGTGATSFVRATPLLVSNAIDTIYLGHYSAAVLPAGSIITVYGAKEV